MTPSVGTDEARLDEVTPTRGPRSSISPGALISATAVLLAALIVALVLTPAGLWRHPATDAIYKGFDSNLLYISPTGPSTKAGVIKVSSDALTISATAQSHPTVHLLTTPLSFSTAFDVEIIAEPRGTVPLRIELWSPETGAGYFLLFDRDGGNVIRVQTVVGGVGSQDLIGGRVKADQVLGQFTVGQPYHVILTVDSASHAISGQITGLGVTDANFRVTPAEAPELFKAFRPTLTVSSSAVEGVLATSEAVIRNYSVTLPSQPAASAEQMVKVDDGRARWLLLALLAASIGICLFVGLRWLARRLSAVPFGAWRSVTSYTWKETAPVLLLLMLAGALYLVANMPLFGLASPHFDIAASKIWAYVAAKDGFTDLYYRTLLVPAAGAWQGVPVREAPFPYGVTSAYYYFVVGVIERSWLNPPGPFLVNTFSFEALLKAFNVLAGFADGILAYLILRRLVSRPTALTSAILLTLNPALILVMSVWGSTESISIFFVLASIWLAEEQKPLGAWLMLAAAAFTRPQMLVLAFLLGIVYFRKFGAMRNLNAISWAVIVSFLFIAPIALAISPSLPVDYVTRTFTYHFANGQADAAYLGISPANYSIWTLPLYFVSGQHGLDRMWAPSTMPFLGPLTYGQLAAAISIVFLLGVGTLLLFTKRISTQPGLYLPLVAFGLLGWLLVTPGLISRYFVYAIVALILCRKAFTAPTYAFALAVLTTITCICIYGHLALDFLGYSGSANLLSPSNNAISRVLFSLFSADKFITLAAIANIGLLVAVGNKAWHSLRPDRLDGLATHRGA
jgi:hypothetical protein